MKSMDKLTTGVAYGTSAGSVGYWFLQLLDKVTPSLSTPRCLTVICHFHAR